MSKLLEVKNLKTFFLTDDGLVRAVDDVSYDVKEGETLGLVGESGCGKSVSALSIMRLIPYPPGKIVGGQVIFEGQDLLKMKEDQMRHVRGNKIAMIFQEPMTSLNPLLTVGRQVSEPLEIHQNVKKKEALKQAVKLLESVKIPEAELRAQAYPHHFSGGMRQRSMISMGMGCNPSLIIADEPTTALDVTVQAQLLELLKGLTREHGMPIGSMSCTPDILWKWVLPSKFMRIHNIPIRSVYWRLFPGWIGM
jgi:oligopeptide transport system ATP-binding protein